MAVLFAPWGNQQFFDESGNPATGWKIYSYVAGSSTALATYTTSAGSVSQTNPIVIDALGFATGGQVWLTSGLSYKLVLTDANGIVKKTEDNVTGVASGSSVDQWVTSGLTPTYISATSFTLAGDQTSAFHVGRRIKATVTAGTVYGTITSSAFGALTTVTLEMDSGNALDSGLTAVSYGLLSKTSDAIPRGIFPTIADVLPSVSGLTYSNNAGDATNDIDIAAGVAIDSTGVAVLRLASTLTKRLDAAWAVGTNQGGLDTGAIGNSDYYIWLIGRADTGVVDALFSLSSTAPTMPANYTRKRLIGWFKRVGGTIVPFTTYELTGGGLELMWTTPTLDINLANTLTTARRTDAAKVPLNFSVLANMTVVVSDASTNGFAWVGSPDQADVAPSLTAAPLYNAFWIVTANASSGQQMRIRTSAAGLIAARANIATVDLYAAVTNGFEWSRR